MTVESTSRTKSAGGLGIRRSLSEQVAEAITEKLIADGLKPGDKLPTEPELEELYSVSRGVIREAGRILTERGLVDIRAGRGMIVAELNGEALSRHFGLILELQQGTFRQLMEMRLVLEVGMTEYAAVHHRPEDLVRIKAAIADFARTDISQSEALQADIDFHSSIADASHNPFFQHVINPVNDYLRKVYEDSLGYDSARAQTLAEHARIAEAIEAGDAAAAAAAARTHLIRVLASSGELTAQAGLTSASS